MPLRACLRIGERRRLAGCGRHPAGHFVRDSGVVVTPGGGGCHFSGKLGGPLRRWPALGGAGPPACAKGMATGGGKGSVSHHSCSFRWPPFGPGPGGAGPPACAKGMATAGGKGSVATGDALTPRPISGSLLTIAHPAAQERAVLGEFEGPGSAASASAAADPPTVPILPLKIFPGPETHLWRSPLTTRLRTPRP